MSYSENRIEKSWEQLLSESSMNEVVARSKKLGMEFDHNQHNVLYNASKDIVGVEGIVCEVGLREGGGMGVMILGCIDSNNTDRPFLAIDPYGNLVYSAMEGVRKIQEYTNEMKYKTMINLYKTALEYNLLIDLITLEDTEFFKRFEDGLPVYNSYKKIYNNYALVHLDGPHSLDEVMVEVDFFINKISINGYIVLDDVTYYNLSKLEEKLFSDGKFVLVENDRKKASYKRVR